jgi:hypothetical protein
MSVLATFVVRGDTEDLLSRLDAAMPRIIEVSPAKPLAHVCVPAEHGVTIYDVWESAEVLDDFSNNPQFGEALAEAGLPAPEVTVTPVHRFNW